MNKEIAIQNLKEISTILEKNNVRNFLVYGSCLGAVREGNIIEHDLDTDLGIMAEDWNFDILRQFFEAGYEIRNIYGMFNYGCEIAIFKDRIKTDIMFFYKDENKGEYWNCLWDNNCVNGESDKIKHVYPLYNFNDFGQCSLGEVLFNVPVGTENYLCLVYGENWRTPVKEFNWRVDHQCREHE
ncbi:MAG: LicD family protein [Bacteroidales bacterium]